MKVAAWVLSVLFAFVCGIVFAPGGQVGNDLKELSTPVAVAPAQPSPDQEPAPASLDTGPDLRQTIRGALLSSDPMDLQFGLMRALADLDRQSVDEALAEIEQCDNDMTRTMALMILMNSWAKFDPEGALGYSMNQGGRIGMMAANEAIRAWATNDPQSALAWAGANGGMNDANPFLAAVIRGWVTNNVAGAETFTKTLPEGLLRERAIASIANQYLTMGAGSLKEWVASIEAPAYRESAMASAARLWGVLDPSETAKWISGYAIEDSSAKAVSSLIGRWSRTDPAEAAEWLSRLPEGGAREQGVVALSNEWLKTDATAVGEYLNSQPPSPFLDQAIARYAQHAANEAPEIAMSWSESIIDPETRRSSIIAVAQKGPGGSRQRQPVA